jgi:acetyltransferase-like isoleucine patch superfamily enzyme
VIIDDHCVIESRVMIGKRSLVTYRTQICNDAQIGERCVIGGFIGERTRVGNVCRVFGQIVHLQHNPSLGWDDDQAMEKSAVIEDEAFIGFNAFVIGGLTVGRKAYVCAGAIVTTDVPDLHIASGINCIVPFSEWRGRLSKSPFFIAP